MRLNIDGFLNIKNSEEMDDTSIWKPLRASRGFFKRRPHLGRERMESASLIFNRRSTIHGSFPIRVGRRQFISNE